MSKMISFFSCIFLIVATAYAFETKDGPQAVRIQFKHEGRVNDEIRRVIMKTIECKRDAGEVAVYSKKIASNGIGHICVQFKSDQGFMQGLLLIQKAIRDHAGKFRKDAVLRSGVTTIGHPSCDGQSLEDFITSDQTLDRMGEQGLSTDKCAQK